METASSSSLTYRMSIMGVVGGCGQLLYWMGGARRMDGVVELGGGGARRRDWDVPGVVLLVSIQATITFPSSPLIILPSMKLINT